MLKHTTHISIPIPKDDYDHFQNLVQMRSPDYNHEESIVLGMYYSDEKANLPNGYMLTFRVYNPPAEDGCLQIISFEYGLFDLYAMKEIASSPIFTSLEESWEFEIGGKLFVTWVKSK